MERSLQKAAAAATRLELSVVSGPATASAGEQPSEPVVFALTDDNGHPVAGAAIEVSYVTLRSGRDVIRTASLITDESGQVSFDHPPPGRVGELTVTARLDMAPLLALLDGLPPQARAGADAVRAAVLNVRAVHRFVVLSRAREIPTAVLVQDTDATGVLMPASQTAAAIMETLSQLGFAIRSVSVDMSQLQGQSVAQLVPQLRERLPADVQRVIVGNVAITDFRQEDGYLARVSGAVTAVDLESGSVLFSASGVKNALSRTADRAIATAFSELGRQLAEQLAANMP
jgi:hypothetical protein